MRRLLLLALALFALVWWLVRKLIPTQPSRKGPRDLPRDGVMVRDRVCNTFLPRGRALVERVGSEEVYFCSERCREAFLANRGDPPAE